MAPRVQIGMNLALWESGQTAEGSLEGHANGKPGDHVARPVRQDRDTGQREANSERSDHSTGSRGQSAGRGLRFVREGQIEKADLGVSAHQPHVTRGPA